ncbi:Retinol dehydrogenase 7 [Caenorhabditis elegans]|uniref:Retinol dehydrogenase 7 n=1 Tax=Caenorhabditis elegans TaxID=6239 RepID=Q20012_CAEEL|nr:Retinol dehydrogenase 7 [Caenorhabditis elegans]CAA98465.3 Retinol dehydrogenase 7 [Caenorhabditis elegans]|eukprot:NP_505941.3 DeHydrogenases, Short chain [Caenorhabditis elegans]
MVVCCLCTLFTWVLYFVAVVVVWNIVRYILELIPEGGSLQDRAILITGCDTGFGRELAKKCAKNGFLVFAGCLTTEAAKTLESESANPRLRTVPLDVSKDESVEKTVEFVKKSLGNHKLWGVVNNAGIFSCYGPDDWCRMNDYKLALDVNCLGVIRVTQAFKKLVKAAKGRIVTVTSVNGRLSTPAAGPYVVSKFGAAAYMDCIRQELYNFGVKVSILEPGIFRTPLLDEQAMLKRVDHVWTQIDDETRTEYGETFKNYFAKMWNKTYISMSTTKIHYVVDNYYHALTAKYPRHRYYCGWDAIFVYVPLSLLPTWWADYVIRSLGKQEVVPACLEDSMKKKN